jgi:hypothetical protein
MLQLRHTYRTVASRNESTTLMSAILGAVEQPR